MANTILEMRDISKSFPGVKALQDVSISIEEGTVHAICGENGAGKSTLMKVLSGVYPHGTFDGWDPAARRAGRVSLDQRLRGLGHRHHPPGARALAVPVDRREHLSSATRSSAAASSTGTRRTSRPANCLPRWGSRTTRSPRSWTSASASSSSWRSRRRSPRRCGSSSSTSRPPRSTTTTRRTCST